MEESIKKLYEKDHLTQKDIIQLLLHNAQHMVTREELKEDNRDLKEDISNLRAELKEDIDKLDKKINDVKAELKEDIDKLDKKINDVKTELKEDINKLDIKIDKVDSKFDRLQWLIVATIISVFFKDYIISFIQKIFN